ncbi:MAG: hypothetical protein R3C04_11325 [Hyphomonas sp.]
MAKAAYHYSFDHEHLLSIDGLSPLDITTFWTSPISTPKPRAPASGPIRS